MPIYADTSFLFSLYVNDGNSERALKLLPAIRQTLPFTPLHRLELRNALAQWVFRFSKGGKKQAMDSVTAAGVWASIETDLHGVLSDGRQLDWLTVISEAERLSARYTPLTGTGSLDTLHVAAALNLDARTFISFDDRQRRMATQAGLTVLD